MADCEASSSFVWRLVNNDFDATGVDAGGAATIRIPFGKEIVVGRGAGVALRHTTISRVAVKLTASVAGDKLGVTRVGKKPVCVWRAAGEAVDVPEGTMVELRASDVLELMNAEGRCMVAFTVARGAGAGGAVVRDSASALRGCCLLVVEGGSNCGSKQVRLMAQKVPDAFPGTTVVLSMADAVKAGKAFKFIVASPDLTEEQLLSKLGQAIPAAVEVRTPKWIFDALTTKSEPTENGGLYKWRPAEAPVREKRPLTPPEEAAPAPEAVEPPANRARHANSCYNCGATDHWAERCPHPQRVPKGACYNCGNFGHFARSCSFPRAKLQPAPQQAKDSENVGGTRAGDSHYVWEYGEDGTGGDAGGGVGGVGVSGSAGGSAAAAAAAAGGGSGTGSSSSDARGGTAGSIRGHNKDGTAIGVEDSTLARLKEGGRPVSPTLQACLKRFPWLITASSGRPRASPLGVSSSQATVRVNLNEHLTGPLVLLAKIKKARNEDLFSRRVLMTTAQVLENLEFKVTSIDQLRDMPECGGKTLEKVQEILQTGKLARIEHLLNNPAHKLKSIIELLDVHGIGPETARRLVYVEGITGIETLKKRVDLLDRIQQIGVKYYEDLKAPVPRAEVEQIYSVVVAALDGVMPGSALTPCGSYRRGKAFSSDVDLIITDNTGGTPNLSPLIKRLVDTGYIIESFSAFGTGHDRNSPFVEASRTFFSGLIRLKHSGAVAHQIDFWAYSRDAYPFAVLGFTGSATFVRSTRRFARLRGMQLTDTTLRPAVFEGSRTVSLGDPIVCREERDIFDALGLEFVEPWQRNVYATKMREDGDSSSGSDADSDAGRRKRWAQANRGTRA